jgi:hypothetical protein
LILLAAIPGQCQLMLCLCSSLPLNGNHERTATMKTRECLDCGAPCHGNQLRCDPHREQWRRAGRKQGKRKKARQRACACGADITGTGRRRCAECAKPQPRVCADDGCTEPVTTPHARRCGPHRAEAARQLAGSAYMMAWQQAHPLQCQLWGRRREARKKGLDFEITVADIEAAYPADGRCGICGVVVVRGKSRADCPSIDRIDNTLGYLPGNIHVICLGCNGRKGSRSLAELAGRADALGAWARKRQVEHEQAEEAPVPDLRQPRRPLVHRNGETNDAAGFRPTTTTPPPWQAPTCTTPTPDNHRSPGRKL